MHHQHGNEIEMNQILLMKKYLINKTGFRKQN
jgi:hypothetical protein